MNKEKFNYYWKVILIIILILGMVLMFYQFNNINKAGIECRQNPFIYGAKVMTERVGVEHFSCSCYVTGENYYKTYSFNENKENPFLLQST